MWANVRPMWGKMPKLLQGRLRRSSHAHLTCAKLCTYSEINCSSPLFQHPEQIHQSHHTNQPTSNTLQHAVTVQTEVYQKNITKGLMHNRSYGHMNHHKPVQTENPVTMSKHPITKTDHTAQSKRNMSLTFRRGAYLMIHLVQVWLNSQQWHDQEKSVQGHDKRGFKNLLTTTKAHIIPRHTSGCEEILL